LHFEVKSSSAARCSKRRRGIERAGIELLLQFMSQLTSRVAYVERQDDEDVVGFEVEKVIAVEAVATHDMAVDADVCAV